VVKHSFKKKKRVDIFCSSRDFLLVSWWLLWSSFEVGMDTAYNGRCCWSGQCMWPTHKTAESV